MSEACADTRQQTPAQGAENHREGEKQRRLPPGSRHRVHLHSRHWRGVRGNSWLQRQWCDFLPSPEPHGGNFHLHGDTWLRAPNAVLSTRNTHPSLLRTGSPLRIRSRNRRCGGELAVSASPPGAPVCMRLSSRLPQGPGPSESRGSCSPPRSGEGVPLLSFPAGHQLLPRTPFPLRPFPRTLGTSIFYCSPFHPHSPLAAALPVLTPTRPEGVRPGPPLFPPPASPHPAAGSALSRLSASPPVCL